MFEVLLISSSQIQEILSMDDVLKAVEYAFKLEAKGKVIQPPKVYVDLPEYQGDFRELCPPILMEVLG